ncbi:hypothetical protein BDP81DRAFT_392061 [Colletotrichum phormii]|uniref:Glycine-rich domain-containing protein 1 n=1 Tax=Colletotrichum phormii TaxID=359342 RepID=A0AAI9ZVJ4_9PEZI|nr:uncharacterized protein BDP81DRAFT_392061 [Colletotrichum phormii]KAK1638610.1 hypothetical protein BDP81DRAFT_392061 [Colletotrichum phormii]
MWKKKQKSNPAPRPPEGTPGSTPEITAKRADSAFPSEPDSSAPLPAHGTDSIPEAAGIATGLGLNLALPSNTPPPPSFPTQDTCLAHLRLLTAFNRLKTETGYRDGLWNIWDVRADNNTRDGDSNGNNNNPENNHNNPRISSRRMCDAPGDVYREDVQARDIMAKLLNKYARFVEIIAIASSTEDKGSVPTLDVDLAWHTHQLSPQSYFDFPLAKTGTFLDHNDKVDEDKLSTAFEWTSKTYQEKHGEIYSECKCWYCEILEAWHAASKVNNVPMPPAAESAHVSSHPAVHTNETTAQRTATRPLRLEYRNTLEATHSKARKRASETFKADSGKRMGPRGEDKTSFWGKDVAVDGPWASVLAAVTTSSMYPVGPGFANMGPGVVGSCATGTCGGATGCGSELLGMCSAGCVGSAWFGGKAGCTGMGEGGFDI